MKFRIRLLPLLTVLLGLPVSQVPAQHSSSSPGAYEPRIARILVDSTAVRPVLRGLWEESISTRREQVACIGGERRGNAFRIGAAADLRQLLAAKSEAANGELDSDSVSVSGEWSRLSVVPNVVAGSDRVGRPLATCACRGLVLRAR